MHGLESVVVARGKPNPIKLLLAWWITNSIVGGIISLNSFTYNYDPYGYDHYSYSDPTIGLVTIGVLTAIGFLAYYFLNKEVTIRLLYGKDSVQWLTIHPPLWERLFGQGGLTISLEEANRIAQVFRVLKDS
jgi:hypothetical protein